MLCILGAQVTLFTVFWSHITMPADETWQTQKRWHADLQSLPPSPSSSDNLHRPMWGKNKRHKGYESLYTRVGAFHRTPFYYFPPHHLKKLLGSILYTLLHIGPSSSHSRQFLFFFLYFFLLKSWCYAAAAVCSCQIPDGQHYTTDTTNKKKMVHPKLMKEFSHFGYLYNFSVIINAFSRSPFHSIGCRLIGWMKLCYTKGV